MFLQKTNIDEIKIYDSSLSQFNISDNCIVNTVNCNSPKLKSFVIRDSKVKKNLTFSKELPDSVFIGDGEYNKVELQNTRDIKSFHISGLKKYKEYDENKELGEQTSHLPINDNIPLCDGLIIDEFKCFALNNTGDLFVEMATIKKLEFERFINKGDCSFINVDFIEEVSIIKSNIEKCLFNDISFLGVKLAFDHSFIDGAIFSNIIWPLNYQIESKETGNNELLHRIKRESYRQLKNNSKNNSNNIDAIKFYRNEMDEYWEYSKLNSTDGWSNRLLVWVNKWSSDFGQRYWWPLAWLFSFHLFFFIVLFFTKYNFEFQFNPDLSCTSESFKLAIGEFLRLLNPAHKMAPEMKGLYIFIDMFMRISAGFFIYQFIRATRKFARL